MTMYGPGDPRGVYAARNSDPPVPFTIGGKAMEQLDQEAAARAAAQQRQAAAAAALNGDQTPCDAAQAAYDTMRRVPQQQRAFNAYVEARAAEYAKEFGLDNNHDVAKVNKFVAAERAKFANTTDGQIPGTCRQSMAERRAEADRKLDAVRAALTPKSNDVAELMRQKAIWDAERKLLDSKDNIGVAAAVAAKAIENATDIEEVTVYAREFPKYFEARGHEDISFVDQALTAKVPEYRAAKQHQREEQIYGMVTDHTAAYLERCAASGQPADPCVLAKLDPSKIQSARNMGRRA